MSDNHLVRSQLGDHVYKVSQNPMFWFISFFKVCIHKNVVLLP